MMTDVHQIYDLKRKRMYFGLVGFVGIAILGVLLSLSAIQTHFYRDAAKTHSATLRLSVDSLRLTLDRYSRIPVLVTRRPEVSEFLSNPNSAALRSRAESLLSETAKALGANGVYLEDAQGQLLASAGTDTGQSLSDTPQFYRPYFDSVIAGGTGQYYALGTESGERGYFYAEPVRRDNRIQGVVAVRFSVNKFEASLRDADAEVIVRDSNDIVFISSRDAWNFKSFTPLSDQKRAIIASAKQFPLQLISYFANDVEELEDNISIIKFEDEAQSYIVSTSLLARPGWRVTILSPTRDAQIFTAFTAGGAILTILLAASTILLIWQGQIGFAERMSEQRKAKRSLEKRVQQRTEELNQSNSQLMIEIEERRETERQLRQTQTELIQAGKLAALGQMSAAISHEFNQPLAATKAYAENASTLIDRDRVHDARDNIVKIASMVDRMSSIAKHLRNFARRPQEKTKPVSILSAVDTVFELMNAQLASRGVMVSFDRPKNDIWVIGGDVRLQQVLLNLVRNALKATEKHRKPKLTLKIETIDDKVHISVEDNGHGVDDNLLKKVFDPFFTTKDPGQGMGLGLSISYNIIKDFGGELSVENSANGGAIFKIILLRTEAPTVKEAAQ